MRKRKKEEERERKKLKKYTKQLIPNQQNLDHLPQTTAEGGRKQHAALHSGGVGEGERAEEAER